MNIKFKTYIPKKLSKKTTKEQNKTSKANKQTLNNKDPNKTRNYFDIKISIFISRCILLSLS